MAKMLRETVMMITVVLMLVGSSYSDVNQDKQECASQLTGLAPCLPFVGGHAKIPTPDCCTGVKQVLKDSKKCICILVKDRNDPGLGLKFNASLAMSLPKSCHTPQTLTVSECLELLHLSPSSPEAKVFSDFAKGVDSSSASTPTSASTGKSSDSGSSSGTSSAKETSDGGSIEEASTIMIYGSLLALLMI